MDFLQLLFLLAVLVVIFLLIREVILWYYKINERVELLKQNNGLLTEIRDILKQDTPEGEKINKSIKLSAFEGDGDLNDPKVFDNLMQQIKK